MKKWNKYRRYIDEMFAIILFSIPVVFSFFWSVIRLPIRLTICNLEGHRWKWLGNGFFGLFAPEKDFGCKACGFKTAEPEQYKTHKNYLK